MEPLSASARPSPLRLCQLRSASRGRGYQPGWRVSRHRGGGDCSECCIALREPRSGCSMSPPRTSRSRPPPRVARVGVAVHGAEDHAHVVAGVDEPTVWRGHLHSEKEPITLADAGSDSGTSTMSSRLNGVPGAAVPVLAAVAVIACRPAELASLRRGEFGQSRAERWGVGRPALQRCGLMGRSDGPAVERRAAWAERSETRPTASRDHRGGDDFPRFAGPGLLRARGMIEHTSGQPWGAPPKRPQED